METKGKQTIREFINQYGIACGGDWAQMTMQAIKNGLPEVYAKLEDRSYTFTELWKIVEDNI